MDQIRAHDSFSFSLLYVIFDYPFEELSGTFRKHLDPKQLKIICNYLVVSSPRSSSTYISDALGHLRHYDLDSLPRRELCQDDPHREKLVVGLFERVYCDSESRGSNHVGSEPRKDVSHLYLHVCLVVVDKIFGALLDHQVHVPHLAAGEGWAQGRPQAFPFFSAHEQQVFGQERVRVGLAETDVTLEVVEVLRGDLLDEVKIADQKEVLSELHVPNISFFWIFEGATMKGIRQSGHFQILQIVNARNHLHRGSIFDAKGFHLSQSYHWEILNGRTR
jgi:hypothetical protein